MDQQQARRRPRRGLTEREERGHSTTAPQQQHCQQRQEPSPAPPQQRSDLCALSVPTCETRLSRDKRSHPPRRCETEEKEAGTTERESEAEEVAPRRSSDKQAHWTHSDRGITAPPTERATPLSSNRATTAATHDNATGTGVNDSTTGQRCELTWLLYTAY